MCEDIRPYRFERQAWDLLSTCQEGGLPCPSNREAGIKQTFTRCVCVLWKYVVTVLFFVCSHIDICMYSRQATAASMVRSLHLKKKKKNEESRMFRGALSSSIEKDLVLEGVQFFGKGD